MSRNSSTLSKPVLLQSTHHSFFCRVEALLLEKGGAKETILIDQRMAVIVSKMNMNLKYAR